VDIPRAVMVSSHSLMCLCMPGRIIVQSSGFSSSNDTVPWIMLARTRKFPDVQVDVSEESVVTLVRVFGVIRVRHEVGVLIRPKCAIDGEVLRILTHYLLTEAVVTCCAANRS
jgi:hypothetical protein